MTKRLASAITGLACVCLVGSASAGIAFSNVIARPEIIQVTEGVKFFRDGDSITITEVKATSPNLKTGDKVIVKGHYALSSKQKASLFLSVTDTKGPGKMEIRPEQKIDITEGQGEFELSATFEYDGYLHVTFYSTAENKPFGELYFGTAQQMEEIKHWDLRHRHTADSETRVASQESKAQDSKTMDSVDPMVGQAIADAQKLQSCPPFSGKPLWDNGIRFTVAGEPVKSVSIAGIRAAFDAKDIPTTSGDIHKLSAFIGEVASKAAQFKGKSIDLTSVLSQMRETR